MMLFDGWSNILRVVVAGATGYIALVIVLRASGKRTLSKMNAFDLVVTVALGSTFATVLLSKDVAVLEGVTAFALLAALQYAVAWAAVRSDRIRKLVKSAPTLLFYRGAFDEAALKAERITKGEVLAALREQGVSSLGQVEAVVLETAGELSVLTQASTPFDALTDVKTPSDR